MKTVEPLVGDVLFAVPEDGGTVLVVEALMLLDGEAFEVYAPPFPLNE